MQFGGGLESARAPTPGAAPHGQLWCLRLPCMQRGRHPEKIELKASPCRRRRDARQAWAAQEPTRTDGPLASKWTKRIDPSQENPPVSIVGTNSITPKHRDGFKSSHCIDGSNEVLKNVLLYILSPSVSLSPSLFHHLGKKRGARKAQ